MCEVTAMVSVEESAIPAETETVNTYSNLRVSLGRTEGKLTGITQCFQHLQFYSLQQTATAVCHSISVYLLVKFGKKWSRHTMGDILEKSSLFLYYCDDSLGPV